MKASPTAGWRLKQQFAGMLIQTDKHIDTKNRRLFLLAVYSVNFTMSFGVQLILFFN